MNPIQDAAWRRCNMGRILNNAVWRFETRILELLAAAGYPGVTLTHINLTKHLDIDGTRATELARRASMTKQSMGELVLQVERMGLVTRVPDPRDGRARIVRFTPLGLAWLDAFRLAIEQAEAEMRDEIGAPLFDALKQGLPAYARRD